jgi:endoglycosylceramidase
MTRLIKSRLRTAVKAVVGAGAVLALAFPAYAPAAPVTPLDHTGRWITDSDGRVVILHGWNMVYKVGSYRPEDAGFGDDDARFLADNGFNTVRLGVIYKGLEATPSLYDDAYLESIARTESILAGHGIFSLLDFHQDMYNERFQGEGFPDWAVVGDAATLPAEPKLGFPANYLEMPALNRAYDHFWLNDLAVDGRTLQDAYAAAWRHVAGRFADNPHVLGYNLFNEPWPGSQYPSCTSNVGCPVFDQQFLQPFSERVIAAIRQADPNTLAWYAPLLTFDFGADTSHGDTGDAHAGFAFNMYCLAELGDAVADLGPATGPECDTGYGLTLDNAEQQSLETGDALLMTEFAATDDLSIIKRVVELADERMISWQQWHYCGCDDPTTSGPGIQALVGDAAQPPTGTNVNDQKLLVSSRPYPQAVAGTPESFGFNDETKEFHLDYSTARADGSGNFPAGSRTEIFVPKRHFPNGYAVDVQGAGVVSAPGASVLTLASCGTEPITVRVSTSGGPPQRCPGDLSLTKTDSPDPIVAGQTLTYKLTARNAGPTAATNVTVTDTLPASVSFQSATSSQGSACTRPSATVVRCNLGGLASGGQATVTIKVKPQSPGTITNRATIAASEADPYIVNNTAQATTTVKPGADLALTKTDSPDPAHVGQNLFYTLAVKNNGPQAATGVTVTDPLPKTTGFGSATASQGTCTRSKQLVVCSLGTIAAGKAATATILVKPTEKGTITNTASVSLTSPTDPKPTNNTATATTTVEP